MLVFVMILFVSTKNVYNLVYKRYCVVQKPPRYDESEMRYMSRNNARERP